MKSHDYGLSGSCLIFELMHIIITLCFLVVTGC